MGFDYGMMGCYSMADGYFDTLENPSGQMTLKAICNSSKQGCTR
jgi:hypothetical protein